MPVTERMVRLITQCNVLQFEVVIKHISTHTPYLYAFTVVQESFIHAFIHANPVTFIGDYNLWPAARVWNSFHVSGSDPDGKIHPWTLLHWGFFSPFIPGLLLRCNC